MRVRRPLWLLALPAVLLTFLLSTSARACLDFSGSYQSVQDDGTLLTLTLRQKGCQSVLMEYLYSDGMSFNKKMVFDGVYRVIFDEPSFKTIEAFSMKESEIQFAAKLENKMSGSKNSLKGTFTLDTEGNLVEEKTFYDQNGTARLKVVLIHEKTSQSAGQKPLY